MLKKEGDELFYECDQCRCESPRAMTVEQLESATKLNGSVVSWTWANGVDPAGHQSDFLHVCPGCRGVYGMLF